MLRAKIGCILGILANETPLTPHCSRADPSPRGEQLFARAAPGRLARALAFGAAAGDGSRAPLAAGEPGAAEREWARASDQRKRTGAGGPRMRTYVRASARMGQSGLVAGGPIQIQGRRRAVRSGRPAPIEPAHRPFRRPPVPPVAPNERSDAPRVPRRAPCRQPQCKRCLSAWARSPCRAPA
jgi:hypothetical protein